jgi:capsular polysaccharide biosynthesis protein
MELRIKELLDKRKKYQRDLEKELDVKIKTHLAKR